MQSRIRNVLLALMVCVAIVGGPSAVSAGLVNVELRPPTLTIGVGEPVEVGLYAVSAEGNDQPVGLVGVVLVWDADYLALAGHLDNGPFVWDASGFPTDSAGVNDTFSDGTAYYQAIAPEGGPTAVATADGLLVATLQFTVQPAATGLTSIGITSCIGWTCTLVLDRHPLEPGVTDITGSIADPVEVGISCQTDPQCDDQNPCTDDSCSQSYTCVNDPNDANDPDDGLFCNGQEYCAGGQVEIEEGTLPDCDDGLFCTIDICNEVTHQCDHELDEGYCLIGGICYSDGSINPTSECEQCNSLVEPEAWSFSAVGFSCGSPTVTQCNGADTCDGFGVCQANWAPAGTGCGNPTYTQCSAPDTCDGAGACLSNHYLDGTPCNDGLFCTLIDTCSTGLCTGTGGTCPDQTCDEFTNECKAVGLELRPPLQGPFVSGETISVGLYAVSETGTDQPIAAVSVILVWDPLDFELLGTIDDGPYEWVSSGFPDDSGLDGLNNTFLDGNAVYEAWGYLVPNPAAVATPDGLRVTTLQLRALSAGTAYVEVVADFGVGTETMVLDGETPGLETTGTLGPPAAVEIIACLEDAHCNDGEFCDGVERCVDTVCVAGVEPDCDDGVFCNGDEVCQPGVGCVSVGNPCPEPSSCDEVYDNCGGCDAPTVIAEGCRYLAVTPAYGDDPVAILVTGDPEDLSISCLSAYVQEDGTLDTTPVYKAPGEWGTVHVGDAEIRPSTTYAVHTDCRYGGSGFLSKATRATTWIWGDVNNDGEVYFNDVVLVYDGSQGIFSGGATVENLDVAPCVPNGVIDAEDVARVQNAMSGGGFPCPGPCAACVSPGPAPQPDPDGVRKNRRLSFIPGHPGEQTALRVTLVDLPHPFDAYDGRAMWGGTPRDISVGANFSGATPPPTFQGAQLRCEPAYMDWGTVGVLYVYSNAIIPGATYEVRIINEACNTDMEGAYTDSLLLTTSRWGDIVGDCSTVPCTAPNGVVDFTDISAMVDSFISRWGAPNKTQTDVAPETPDHIVDFVDIPFVVDAFRGLPYPFPPGSAPCSE